MLALKITFTLIIALLLVGCSDLTNEEQKYVGFWKWDIEKNKFGASGYIDLKPNRDYSYSTVTWNPSERLEFSRDELNFGWRISNGYVCLATKWEDGVLGKRSILEEDCRWRIVNGKLVIDDTFIGKILVERKP